MLRHALTCLIGLAVSATAPAAEDEWSLCAAVPLAPSRPAFEQADEDPETVDVEADQADLVEGGVSVLQGNVRAEWRTRYLESQRLTYDDPDRILEARGDVRVWDRGIYLTGEQVRTDLDAEESTVDAASYMLEERHAHGDAERIVITGSEIIRAREASYTTCDPGDEVWVLTASSIRLDNVNKVGHAWNVLVRFKGVPIFYSPFLRFPLSDERKTGFLTPSAGVSGETGVELSTPFYLNLAPNMDATLTPRLMSRRGALLGAEYRYLTRSSQGVLGAEYLPDDDQRGDDRGAISFRHETQFSRRLNAKIDYNAVSDDDYLEELGTDLSISSTRFLERRGDLNYSGRRWWARARLQDFQTVDETVPKAGEPYERLPQLLVQSRFPERNWRPHFDLGGEFVNFQRDAGVRGLRTDLSTTVSYPMRTAAAFAVPSADVRYTQYLLENTAPRADDAPKRVVPTLAFDSGAFFERDLNLRDRSYIQTLEPRLFYLYVPFDDQRDLPNFDTGRFTFSFAQLFRTDRFNGADRVGDANQLSLALTSRLLTPGGDEVLRASVGQIRFFRDRDVNLPGERAETDDSSALVAEVAATLRRWRVLGGVQWNPNEPRTDRSTISLRYQPDPGRVVNLSYRFVRGAVEQTDASFRWPLSDQWAVVGRWNYSIPEERTLEAVGGIEYESCCWALRVVGRRFVNDVDADATNAIFLQLELKGLAGVGGAGEFLERSIPGYRNEF